MSAEHTMQEMFGAERALIGVIHVDALPGAPAHCRSVADIARKAVEEAVAYRDAGFHALLIENMHDRPYVRRSVGPETVAAMAVIGGRVAAAVALPLGVQILAGANRQSLAVAQACGAAFIRAEGFVFGHLADEGWMDSDAGGLLRYRKAIGAESVRVFADIKKKHAAHSVTADVDLAETARAAEFFLADALVVTGVATGRPTDPAHVELTRGAVEIPVLVGSGVDSDNLREYTSADGLIVGSAVKRDGLWSNPLDVKRLESMATAFRGSPE